MDVAVEWWHFAEAKLGALMECYHFGSRVVFDDLTQAAKVALGDVGATVVARVLFVLCLNVFAFL